MSTSGKSARVVVVGGGITGLTAAYRLMADGVDVTVLERDGRLGGKILTERHDGFVLEDGPDGFLATKAAGRELCEELGVPLVGSRVAGARASVLWDRRLHPLPDGLKGVLPTRIRPILQSDLFSPAGKARMLLRRALPARRPRGDEPLGVYVRRRLGREVWERLVEPLATGVYAGDGDALSLRAAFPGLAATADTRSRRDARAPAPGGPAFLTPEAGLGRLIDALRQRIGEERILTGTGASGITHGAQGYRVALDDGDAIPADAVIVAAPAHAAADLVGRLDPALAVELAGVPHASTALVTVAIPTESVGRRDVGHGFVVPRASGSPVVACSVTSGKWPGRAPSEWTLVRTFIGRAGQPDPLAWDDDTLVGLAREAMRTGLAVDVEPSLTRVARWPAAMPQYTVGHLDRVDRVAARVAAHPGLAVAGNFLRGIGIPDCIGSAGEAAAVVRRHLASIDAVR
jgi:oxygen-dependent protoporphyrinogen oxidase